VHSATLCVEAADELISDRSSNAFLEDPSPFPR
jgi:hypothetical protein